MSLEIKHKGNEDIAYKLFENKYYDASTNRYYYSCFQKLLDYAEKNFEYEDSNKGSSHINLIKFVEDKINRSMNRSNSIELVKAKSIKGNFIELKKLRVTADYKPHAITEYEILKVIELVDSFNTKLGIVQKEV